MTALQGAVDATFAPAGGEPVPAPVIGRRPDTIVGFSESRVHAETGHHAEISPIPGA
jgi:hypothetical protein